MHASHPVKSIVVAAAIVAAATFAVLVGIPSVTAQRGASWQARTTWAEYGGGPDGSHFTALTQITKANVGQLEVAWTYPSEGGGEYSPLVAGNLAYVINAGNVVALDAATGKEVWVHDFRQDGPPNPAAPARGAQPAAANEGARGRGR